MMCHIKNGVLIVKKNQEFNGTHLKTVKTREMMLCRFKIIALSIYDMNSLKIIYGI